MSTHLLFDDDGAFKAGTEMANAGTSHQVELPSGKRTKVKTSHVLLRFAEPAPAQLIERAQAQAQLIDLDFLWEVAPQDEFGFVELARDYFGAEPTRRAGGSVAVSIAQCTDLFLSQRPWPLSTGTGRNAEGGTGGGRAQAKAG